MNKPDPQNPLYHAALILGYTGYRNNTGFRVDDSGDYYLVFGGANSEKVNPFGTELNSYEQHFAIEDWLRLPAHVREVWDVVIDSITTGSDFNHQHRSAIIKDCLTMMIARC